MSLKKTHHLDITDLIKLLKSLNNKQIYMILACIIITDKCTT